MPSDDRAGVLKVVFLGNSSWYLWNFRLQMARRLRKEGASVVFIAPEDEYSERLEQCGEFRSISLDRKSLNPLREFLTLRQIYQAIKFEGDCMLVSWTPKANIYGGIASQLLGIPFIPNIAGLGFAFSDSGFLSALVKFLYRRSLRRAETVFFQNTDDMNRLVAAGIVRPDTAILLPGSGVDLNRFKRTDLPERPPFIFLFAGRLIEQKGIRELVAASRFLRHEGYDFVIRIYGFIDPGNPTSLSAEDLDEWDRSGTISYMGQTDRIETELRKAHCVVHPSFYREGRPRILLEAAAAGRPAITTDSIGCRDVVSHGVTGLLCTPRDWRSLANQMETIMNMSAGDLERMGGAARKRAESEYSESIVVSEYLTALGFADGT